MPRRHLFTAATICLVVFDVACSDADRSVLPTTPLVPGQASRTTVLGTCTPGDLVALTRSVIGADSPHLSAALAKLDSTSLQYGLGHVAEAQTLAMSIVTFLQKKLAAGALPGPRAACRC